MQRTIVGLFEGSVHARVFANVTAGMDTSEILEELIAHDALDDARPRKQLMATVVRACTSLIGRGLVEGHYVADANNPGRQTLTWRAKDERR